MIVKVELIDDSDHKRVMMFGDSYKKWPQRLYEYLCSARHDGISYRRYGLLRQSRSKWVSGGLKWCSAESFPAYLLERDNRDAARINFYIASERTVVKLEDILTKVADYH